MIETSGKFAADIQWDRSDATVYRVGTFFGGMCKPQSSKLLLALLRSPNRIVHRDQLLGLIDYRGNEPPERILSVCVSRARAALKAKFLPMNIYSAHATGYYMLREDIDVIVQGLRDAGIEVIHNGS